MADRYGVDGASLPVEILSTGGRSTEFGAGSVLVGNRHFVRLTGARDLGPLVGLEVGGAGISIIQVSVRKVSNFGLGGSREAVRSDFGSLVRIIDVVEYLEGGYAAEVLLVGLGGPAHSELTDVVLVSGRSRGKLYRATDRDEVLVGVGVGRKSNY